VVVEKKKMGAESGRGHLSRFILEKGSFAFLDKVILALMGFIYVVLSVRFLEKAEYGVMMLAFSIFGFLTIFGDTGVGNALIKYAAEKKEVDAVTTTALYLKAVSLVVFSGIAILFAFVLPPLFHAPQLFSLLLFFPAFFTALMASNFFKQILQANQMLKEITLVDSGALVSLVSLFLLARYAGMFTTALVVFALLSVSYIIAAGIGFYMSKNLFKLKNKINHAWKKRIFRFAVFSSMGALGSMIYTRTDMLMLGAYLGPEAVAVYGSCWVIANAMYMVPQSIYMVLFPLSSEISSSTEYPGGWKKRMKEVYAKSVGYSLVFTVPMSLFVIAFPGQIINILYHGKYIESISVLRVLALWGIIRPFGNLSGAVIEGMGKPNVNAALVWATALVNIAANALFIPRFGVMGAAYASILAFFVGVPIGILFLMKKIMWDKNGVENTD